MGLSDNIVDESCTEFYLWVAWRHWKYTRLFDFNQNFIIKLRSFLTILLFNHRIALLTKLLNFLLDLFTIKLIHQILNNQILMHRRYIFPNNIRTYKTFIKFLSNFDTWLLWKCIFFVSYLVSNALSAECVSAA